MYGVPRKLVWEGRGCVLSKMVCVSGLEVVVCSVVI